MLAAVLVVSAVGKLRAPERARDAFTAMGVPLWLNRPLVARAHPWAEIVLALLLLAVTGPAGVAVATAALLLMLVYVVLVVRALRSPVDVDCACFGSLGSERVTGLTVWRNVWLSALAGVTLCCSFGDRSVLGRVGALGNGELWWLVAAAAAALTVALVLHSAPHAEPDVEIWGESEDQSGYVRSRTPAVPVTLADGTTTNLRRLSKERAQLLVYVSEGCGSCQDIIAAVPQWQRELPQIDVRFIVAVSPEITRLTSRDKPLSIHDTERLVWDSFGMGGTPSAVLLGADGLLAGGPVVGRLAVPEFVDEIRNELGVLA